MSKENLILLEPKDKYYLLTLNDPDKLNALSKELIEQLKRALHQIETDNKRNVTLITGAGKAFCAGADIKALNKMDQAQIKDYIENLSDLFLSLRRSAKIFIAAINGYALGGGAELLLNCDLVYASQDARIGFPEIKLGLLPGATGTSSLAAIVGKTRAKHLILTAQTLTGEHTREIGLANQVFPTDKLITECEKIAAQLSIRSPQALKNIKSVIEKSAEHRFEQGLALERKGFYECFDTDLSRELRRLFEQKT